MNKLGHTEVVDAAVAATCITSGLTEGKHCSECGEVTLKQKYVGALGHKEIIEPAVASTCTTKGKTEGKYCETCKIILIYSTSIPALGHTEIIDNGVSPTCTTDGISEGKHCSVCDTVLVKQEVVPAKGHTEVTDAAVTATCTTDGKTEGKHCFVCNTVIVAQTTIPAAGHIFVNKICSVCGEKKTSSGFIFVDYGNGTCGILDLGYCTDTEIIIPSKSPTGETIVSIVDRAFYQRDNLVSIEIPETVTSIGENAFTNCTSLTNIDIPDSVQSIGWGAFAGCSQLSNVKLPNTIKVIERLMFENCVKLEHIDIPSSVTDINYGAFYSCYGIKVFEIPDGIINIGNSVFFDCSNLKKVIIPKSIKSIGACTFDFCPSLTDIYYYGTEDEWNNISISSANNSTLSNVNIHYNYDPNHIHTEEVDPAVPPTCTQTGLTEGTHCSDCGEVIVAQTTVPATGHTEVTDAAVTPACNAIGLTEGTHCSVCGEILIKQEIIAKENHTFVNGFCNVCGEEEFSQGLLFESNGDGTCVVSGIGTCQDTNLIIPKTSPYGDTVTSVGRYAFQGCSNITNIEIPNTVTIIKEGAFQDCNAILNIELPNSVTTIEYGAFAYCENLESIYLPHSLVSIGSVAFSNCYKLDNVTIPASVTTIGSSLFWVCQSLQNITFESGILLTEIPKQMFYHCEELSSIVIPEGVISIGANAFDSCSSLKQISIPDSVTRIDTNAFDDTALTDVYYPGTEFKWRSITIYTGNDKLREANIHYNSEIVHTHTTAKLSGKPANCTQSGLTDGEYCSECGKITVTHQEIPAIGHNMQNDKCTVCGFELVDYTDVSLYASSYGYESLGKLQNANNLQAFYRKIDEISKEFHVTTNIDLSDAVIAKIDLTEYNITYEEAETVISFYRHDHPLYYWLVNSPAYQDSSNIIITTHSVYCSGSVRSSINDAIYSGIEQYANYIYGEEDAYTTVLATYDWIGLATDYVYDENDEPESENWAHSIQGFFEGKGVVCEGFAKVMQLFLNFVEIDNIYVVGYSGGHHAWNLVQLDDGEWYWLDLTWDDNSSDVDYNYFCVNDLQFVNWSDGNLIRPDGYLGDETFMDDHQPYDISQSYDNLRLYDLPERSTTKFSNDSILELRESFTVGSFTYTLVGYNEVQLTYIDAQGVAEVPEFVTYNGKYYKVISIGTINQDGFFEYSDIVVSESVTKVIIPSIKITINPSAFESENIKKIVIVY
ncbi:MAG: leucine-rich repeat protein [Clostridia bacterium]|nr:leucine-rich repeat protein [Clostridia bacterium]